MGIETAAIVAAVAEIVGSTIVAEVIVAVGVALIASAVSYGLSAALAPSAPKGSSAGESSRTQQVRQPITARRIAIGRVMLSGPLFFIHSNKEPSGTPSVLPGGGLGFAKANERLYTAVALCAHRIHAIESLHINGALATDGKFKGLAYIEPHLGDADQEASPLLMAETDGKWTADHRARGVAYLAAAFKYDRNVWSSIPNIAATILGLDEVYDPRTGTTGYSNNAALVAAWYLTSPNGLRCEWEEIDEEALIVAANICDEAIPLKAGGTEPRYSINGVIELDQNPKAILDDLGIAMAGSIIQTGGLWRIKAGAWEEPTLALNESHLRGGYTVQANRSMRDRFNAVRATYIRPDADWQATDAPVRYDEPAIAAEGQVYAHDLDFPMDTSGYAVQRKMQIALRKGAHQRSITAPLNLTGLLALCGAVVRFGTERLAEDTYRITSWKLVPDDQGGMGADVTLEHETPGVWGWDPETDELDLGEAAEADLPGGQSAAPSLAITTPLVPVPEEVAVSCTAVVGAGLYNFGASPDGLDWTDQVEGGPGGDVVAALPSRFRARGQTEINASEWGVSMPPDPPVGLSAVTVPGGIQVGWDVGTAPGAQVFIGGAGTLFEASALDASPTTSTGSLFVPCAPAAVRLAWVRAVGADGNVSAPIGPAEATAGA